MPTVLLADADRELRDTFGAFLSRNGFHVDHAADGLECVAVLRRVVPDLLILDQQLPWGGGDGVLGILSKDPALCPGQILLTSPLAAQEVRDNLPSSLGVEVLTKPFTLSALLPHVPIPTSDGHLQAAIGTNRRGILIVDDEFAIRDFLQALLQRHGYCVWTAASGDEALDSCCDHGEEIDIVLLDVQMPGMNGPQTLDGIRQFDPELPVCFMTGDLGGYNSGELLALGARFVFGKPFRIDEVLRVVRSLAQEPVEKLH